MSTPLVGTAFAVPINHRFYANASLFIRVGAAIAEPKLTPMTRNPIQYGGKACVQSAN